MSDLKRGALCALGGRLRAYFAPVARATTTPVAFDLAHDGPAALSAPPPGWFDAGWITGFTRTAATAVQPLRSGPRGAASAQVRTQLEARVEFAFGDWGKLQMAIAGGSEHFNLLAPGLTPAPLLAGSTAGELQLAADDLAKFSAGDLVSVDLDYTGESGYVGSGIAGAYVADAAAINDDPDFIRRVSFNVARVASVSATALLLVPLLLGGDPPSAAKVQTVVGFADREGGSFFQEWSAIFVVAGAGARVLFYYPRLQPAAPAAEASVVLAEPLAATALRASLRALPVPDPHDGQPALCYRAVFPPASAPAY